MMANAQTMGFNLRARKATAGVLRVMFTVLDYARNIKEDA
jgi:hypothetical protein